MFRRGLTHPDGWDHDWSVYWAHRDPDDFPGIVAAGTTFSFSNWNGDLVADDGEYTHVSTHAKREAAWRRHAEACVDQGLGGPLGLPFAFYSGVPQYVPEGFTVDWYPTFGSPGRYTNSPDDDIQYSAQAAMFFQWCDERWHNDHDRQLARWKLANEKRHNRAARREIHLARIERELNDHANS